MPLRQPSIVHALLNKESVIQPAKLFFYHELTRKASETMKIPLITGELKWSMNFNRDFTVSEIHAVKIWGKFPVEFSKIEGHKYYLTLLSPTQAFSLLTTLFIKAKKRWCTSLTWARWAPHFFFSVGHFHAILRLLEELSSQDVGLCLSKSFAGALSQCNDQNSFAWCC